MTTWLRNSLLVATLGALTVVLSSALIAYGFARLRFRGRKQLFALVMATYMVPTAVTMVPTFLRIFWSIMLPLMKPALAAVAVFGFQAKWNDFMTPLIYLNKPSMYTMSLGLGLFKPDYETKRALWMTASVIFIVPMVLLFVVTQRFFIEGVATTGPKG